MMINVYNNNRRVQPIYAHRKYSEKIYAKMIFRMEQVYKAMVLPIYDLSNSAMSDLLAMLKRKKLYRFAVKNAMNEALSQYARMSEYLEKNYSEVDKAFQADYIDKRTETLKPYIWPEDSNRLPHSGAWPLYQSVKAAVFNQERGKVDADLAATIYVAYHLCALSRKVYKAYQAECREAFGLIAGATTYVTREGEYRLSIMNLPNCEKELHCLEVIDDMLCKYQSYDFLNDFRVIQSQKVLESKATNRELIASDTIGCLDYNPDLKKSFYDAIDQEAAGKELRQAIDNKTVTTIVIKAATYDRVSRGELRTIQLTEGQAAQLRDKTHVILRRGITYTVIAAKILKINKDRKLKIDKNIVNQALIIKKENGKKVLCDNIAN